MPFFITYSCVPYLKFILNLWQKILFVKGQWLFLKNVTFLLMMIFRVKEIYYDLKLHRNIPMYLNTKIVEIERNIQQMAKVSDLSIPLLIYTYTYTYLLPLSLLYPSSLLTCLPFYLDFFSINLCIYLSLFRSTRRVCLKLSSSK